MGPPTVERSTREMWNWRARAARAVEDARRAPEEDQAVLDLEGAARTGSRIEKISCPESSLQWELVGPSAGSCRCLAESGSWLASNELTVAKLLGRAGVSAKSSSASARAPPAWPYHG